jgi:DNA invertase Pin-like site-specific DNA recombinase
VIAKKASGAESNRSGLRRAIASLRPGDILIVTRLDRLARSMRDLLNTLKEITDKGAGSKVLDNPALDTTNMYGKLLISVLGSLAEFERDIILARTREGRQRAKAQGVHIGTPAKANQHPEDRGSSTLCAGRKPECDSTELQRSTHHYWKGCRQCLRT